ncbi:MAG: hypothetical protein ACRD2N_19020 [Vicinamibacterales bacterium]
MQTLTLRVRVHWLIGALAAGLLVSQSAPLVRASDRIASQAAPAACSLNWVGHEAEFETALREGKITKMETVPIGVTKPMRGYFDGGPVARFTWKNLPPGYKSGFMESYKAEIAAYRVDRMLELHRVPPMVERKVDGKVGVVIYWIENVKAWDAKNPPRGPEPKWSHEIVRMKMLDLLIGNIDRNQGNLIYDDDWHLMLIDHSRAFINKKDLKGMAELGSVDRALWAKMQALTFESLKAELSEWVNDNELKAMIIRRDLMTKAIEQLVAKKGEGSVFF